MPHLKSKILNSHKGFTLVELIVTMIILAILATIALLSFSSQSSSSRDSARLSDIASIKKSFGMFNINSGTYPVPDNYFIYVYSGGLLWRQGKLGDNSYRVISKTLSKKVVDPLNGNEYEYSLALNGKDYQIAGDFENPSSLESFNPFSEIHVSALGGSGTSLYIAGNYNGVLLRVYTGSTFYFIPSPTLFGIKQSGTDVMVYDENFGSGKDYLPGKDDFAQFDSKKVYSTGGTDLSISDITDMANTIKSAYSGSNVTTTAVKQIVNSSGASLLTIGTSLIKSVSGGATSPVSTNVVYSCVTKPSYTNATFSTGSPTSANQSWTQTGNASVGCTYVCKTGWKGTDCNTASQGSSSLYAGPTCKTILDNGDSTGDGVYWINPTGSGAYQAYCDMTTDGGGWTIAVSHVYGTPKLLGGCIPSKTGSCAISKNDMLYLKGISTTSLFKYDSKYIKQANLGLFSTGGGLMWDYKKYDCSGNPVIYDAFFVIANTNCGTYNMISSKRMPPGGSCSQTSYYNLINQLSTYNTTYTGGNFTMANYSGGCSAEIESPQESADASYAMIGFR